MQLTFTLLLLPVARRPPTATLSAWRPKNEETPLLGAAARAMVMAEDPIILSIFPLFFFVCVALLSW